MSRFGGKDPCASIKTLISRGQVIQGQAIISSGTESWQVYREYDRDRKVLERAMREQTKIW